MPCLPKVKKDYWMKRLAFYQAELEKLDEAMMNASTEVEEYKLNTGEGMQQTKYRDLEQIQKQISKVEYMIDWILNKLHGWGLVNLNLRRKGYYDGRIY